MGRFAFNKGLDLLIEVARRLIQEGHGDLARFILAGDGPLLAQIRAQGLPQNVELAGRVDDERLFALYTECAALVLPTRFEGMPTVVLEAMARSRPIIVSNVGATAELVNHTNGYLIPSGDAGALYEAIMAFCRTGAAAREAMSHASYARCSSRFGWPQVTSEFLALFEEVAAKAQA